MDTARLNAAGEPMSVVAANHSNQIVGTRKDNWDLRIGPEFAALKGQW
jgi:molybdopterin-guanine dinucleotide biosynthesis protein